MIDGAGRHALLFILIVVIIDSVGLGIIVPVMPPLIVDLTGEPLSSAVLYGGWLTFVYALMQFLCGPVIGNLSDRFGRRTVLLVSMAMMGLDYLVMAIAPNIVWLFVGRTLAGAAGATMGTASAYIADVTQPADRAKSFGYIGGAFGIGFIIGPAVGGLLGELGPRVPFFAASCLAFINMAYGIFVLKESLPEGKRRAFALLRANPIGALLSMRRYPVVLGVFGAIALYLVSLAVYESVWTFYTIFKFHWSVAQNGAALAAYGICAALVSAFLTGRTVRALGETGTAQLGLIACFISFIGFAFAPFGWVMYPFIVASSLDVLVGPALRSIASRSVPDSEQGELQGAFSSVQGAVAILAPLVLAETFHLFTAAGAPVQLPGAPMLLAALLLAMALVVVRRLVRPPAAAGEHRAKQEL
jgi:DHA1 family tetracycline resistance protein-like MFS transporter